jgi:Photosynthesis system II assembly factor YCF48/Putative zinc-finger
MTKSFDHLLRETLKAPVPEPPDGCLDAGVLAAWFEGTLDPAERAAAETHAADCSRCQAALAAMIRIEPAIDSRPWSRSPAFGWLVPITVAAAALVIFIRPYWSRVAPEVAVQQHAPAAITAPATLPPESQAAKPAELDSAAREVTPPTPAVEARTRQVAKHDAKEDALKQQELEKRQSGARAEAPAAPTVVAPFVGDSSLKDRVGVPVDESALQRAASAAAAPAPPSPPVSERSSMVAVGTPPVAEPAPALPSQDRITTGAMAEKGLAETVALNARAAPRTSPQPPVVVQAADGSTRWRVIGPASVQRSRDAGASWEPQSTGVTAIISSGAAPSTSVCWLVGKGGIVLLSADGRSWRRVPFPQSVDLTSIVAADANTATVTTASGRKFTTTDGGKSWK